MKEDKPCRVNVLITSPSTNTGEHIGGIATFTSLLIGNNPDINYLHFVRGRKKDQKRSMVWFLRQPMIFISFFYTLLKIDNLKLVHINMPLDKYAIIRDTLLVIISSFLRKKIILHLHGGKYSMNRATPFLLKNIVKLSVLLSDCIITLGNAEKLFLCDYYKTKPEKVKMLCNAVEISDQLKNEPYNSRLNILFLGRIEKNKGLREVVLALKLLGKQCDFKLLVAGEGPDKDRFLEDCEKGIPGKYEYLGVVSGTKKQSVLSMSHVFLMPSYYEGLPYSLLEAMAYKLVPIVTPVGSIPEIVENGTNGFIVNVFDYYAIYERISELIKNPNLIEILRSNAYNVIRSNYSLEGHIKEINEIYSGLLSAKHLSRIPA